MNANQKGGPQPKSMATGNNTPTYTRAHTSSDSEAKPKAQGVKRANNQSMPCHAMYSTVEHTVPTRHTPTSSMRNRQPDMRDEDLPPPLPNTQQRVLAEGERGAAARREPRTNYQFPPTVSSRIPLFLTWDSGFSTPKKKKKSEQARLGCPVLATCISGASWGVAESARARAIQDPPAPVVATTTIQTATTFCAGLPRA